MDFDVFITFWLSFFFASTKALSVCRGAGSVYMLIAFCCSTVTKPQGYSPKQSRNIFLCAVNFSFFFVFINRKTVMELEENLVQLVGYVAIILNGAGL
jgi:hypothetical protein